MSKYHKRLKSSFRIPTKHCNDLLDKLRNAILSGKLPDPYNNDFGIRWITKEGLAECYKVKVEEIEKCLLRLNIEGIVSQPRHGRDMDGCWRRDIYSVLKTDKRSDNILVNKFGGKDLPHPSNQYNNGRIANFLTWMYRNETLYIEQYHDCAENWGCINDSKKETLINNYISRSIIICCHFLHVCDCLSDVHRRTMFKVILRNYDACFWVFMNCDMSSKERLLLLSKCIVPYELQLSEFLTDSKERKLFFIKMSLHIVAITSRWNLMFDFLKITDKEKDILISRLVKSQDVKAMMKAMEVVNFTDDQKSELAPYVVMARLIGEC